MGEDSLLEVLADVDALLRHLTHTGVREIPLGEGALRASQPDGRRATPGPAERAFRSPASGRAPDAAHPQVSAAGAGSPESSAVSGARPEMAARGGESSGAVAAAGRAGGMPATGAATLPTTDGSVGRFGPTMSGRFGPSGAPPRSAPSATAPDERAARIDVQSPPRSAPSATAPDERAARIDAERTEPGAPPSMAPEDRAIRGDADTPPQRVPGPLDPPGEPPLPEVEPEDPAQTSLLAGVVRARPRVDGADQTPFPGPPPADRAAALSALQQELGDCRRCGLCSSRQTLYFGTGSAQSRVMIVCDLPSADEDAHGDSFRGAAGETLGRILEKVLLLAPGDAYVTHIVKCRPPEGRGPTVREVETCKPFLHRQIDIVRPTIIVALGRIAAQVLLGTPTPLVKLRGHWFSYRGIPVMCTFDPAALVEDPARRRPVFEDMKLVRAKLDELEPG